METSSALLPKRSGKLSNLNVRLIAENPTSLPETDWSTRAGDGLFDGRSDRTPLSNINVGAAVCRDCPRNCMDFLSIAPKEPLPQNGWKPVNLNSLRITPVDDFFTKLSGKVVGQPAAIDAVTDTYAAWLAGMSPAGRPVGNLLMLGPTGTGKTRLFEALAETIVGDARALIKIDCGEFQHSHEIAKLIGSPPGYLGHRETHPLLSQEVLNQYHTEKVKLSFVLFDEIEKASDSLWNLLLGILDKATLTLGDNRRVDFSRAIIGCTSNLGAFDMFKRSMGFVQQGEVDEREYADISAICLEAARRKFAPEFMNRFDHVIPFRPLDRQSIGRILDIELQMVANQLINAGTKVYLRYTDAALAFLIDKGFDKRYGARQLKRELQRRLVKPLSIGKLSGAIQPEDMIKVDVNDAATDLTFAKYIKG